MSRKRRSADALIPLCGELTSGTVAAAATNAYSGSGTCAGTGTSVLIDFNPHSSSRDDNNNDDDDNGIVKSFFCAAENNQMDRTTRVCWRIAVDVILLLCTGLPILYFYLWGKANKRGYFCGDESLMYPYHESTVKSWMLYTIGGVVPVLTIIIVEYLRAHTSVDEEEYASQNKPYEFLDYELPNWLVECYKKIGTFAFGVALCHLITDIAKYNIGRLRPHFFQICGPVRYDGSTCASAANYGKYILDYKCEAAGSTAHQLKEVHLSFPSGHSSFIFYTMVITAIYLQARMNWTGSKLLQHFLQGALLLVAIFTALSRISDYKHHWSDVLVGSSLGVLAAIVTARYVTKLFARPATEPEVYFPQPTPAQFASGAYQYR